MLLQTVVSQNITKKNFCFVPDMMDYTHRYTDDDLISMWKINNNEWNYICSKIGEVGSGVDLDNDFGNGMEVTTNGE